MHSAYLNTRIGLFKGRLWLPAQVAGLAEMADEALPGRLASRGLGLLVGGYADGDRHSLEARIVAILLDETRILLRPLAGPARQFLLYWVARFEVSNVKSLIRAKLAGAGAAAARPFDLGVFTRLDAAELMRAEDVVELMRRLERTAYAEIVRNARQAFEESHDPFILDATLDRAYYEGLMRRARAVAAEADAGFGRLLADLIDRINLVWLLRYRFNYGLPPAQAYYLLPGHGHRLGAERLRALVGADGIAEVLAGLPEPLARQLAGLADIPAIATRLERQAMAQAEAELARPGRPLTRALAYLMLREAGLRDLRAVLRGRRLGLPAADIRYAIGAG